MDKILALLLSVVPNAHTQIVQNDAHSYASNVAVGRVVDCDKEALQASLEGAGLYTKDEKGRYVLNVTKINDDYSYTLKDTQNSKETRFSIESEIQSNVGESYLSAVNYRSKEVQDKASFDEAVEIIKDI